MPKVLVVDDQIDNCVPLVRLLRHMGHEAASVTSGPEALDFIQQHPTKLMLLDIMMPGMDGMEVLRTVRSQSGFHALPIVMFTAVSDQRQHEEARNLGAQDVLVKGRTSFDDLRATVERHVPNPC
jgi:CheY-like chemotaxis protein